MNVPAIGGMQVGQIEAVSTGSTIYQKFPPQLASALGEALGQDRPRPGGEERRHRLQLDLSGVLR